MDRHLSDMLDMFVNTKDVSDNPLIYSFFNTIPNDDSSELLYGETIVYPGNVNGEYFMTKGHTHVVSSAEVYYGLEGTGIVLCEKDGNVEEEVICPGKLVYCKPGYSHRVINNSNSLCRFLCVCRADAGHDYGIGFSKRFFKE